MLGQRCGILWIIGRCLENVIKAVLSFVRLAFETPFLNELISYDVNYA